jgi:actin-related protein 8
VIFFYSLKAYLVAQRLCRLQAIATPLVPNMEKVQIIPPAKDVDQRVLAWKGAAVLGKMDGVSDLWLTAADWVSL